MRKSEIQPLADFEPLTNNLESLASYERPDMGLFEKAEVYASGLPVSELEQMGAFIKELAKLLKEKYKR